MASIHGLQHVERFFRTNLAQNHAVRTHPQGVLDQLALFDFAIAFEIRGSCFHACDVGLLQLQFGRVFNRDQALLVADCRRERVEEGGLT